jgi:predicted nuclease of predicted toxin-antitoxin system
MRILIDSALSPEVGRRLGAAGHDVVHLRDRSLQDAADAVVLALAATESRVLISADTDFGTLLAMSGQTAPSVILLRSFSHEPAAQARLLLLNLPALESHLATGCVAVLERTRIRIRKLPIVC